MTGFKTYLGIFIALVASLLQTQGIVIDVAGVTNVTFEIAGLLLAAYGRAVAKTPGALAPKEGA